jgi:hypothetical protein
VYPDLFEATMSKSSTIFHLGKIISLIPPKKVKEDEIALVHAIKGALFDSFYVRSQLIAIADLKKENRKLKSIWHIKAALKIQKFFNVQTNRFQNNLYVKALNHAKREFLNFLDHVEGVPF